MGVPSSSGSRPLTREYREANNGYDREARNMKIARNMKVVMGSIDPGSAILRWAVWDRLGIPRIVRGGFCGVKRDCASGWNRCWTFPQTDALFTIG